MKPENTYKDLVWVEIDKSALISNAKNLKNLTNKKKVIYTPIIKSNAYGHGLVEAATILQNENCADWLGVNSLWEAEILRQNNIELPIIVLGYSTNYDLDCIFRYPEIRIVVYNISTLNKLKTLSKKYKQSVNVHLKVETGTGRQGIIFKNIDKYIKFFKNNHSIKCEGMVTHYANIEDTTDHSYAKFQLANFKKFVNAFKKEKINIPVKHTACTAATILFPETYFNLARTGIGLYGLWPSKETLLSNLKKKNNKIELKPVLTWKTIIAQIKNLPEGSYIGYGCTYRTTHISKIAILPVGYYDGYDRGLSNIGYVIIKNQRAPILGRVCMNIIIVDITHIKNVKVEDEVILLGKSKSETVSADTLAGMLNTINYEIVTKINPALKRIVK